jgi:hypothetical protein
LDVSDQVGFPQTEISVDHPMIEPAFDDVEPDQEEVNGGIGNDGVTEDDHNEDRNHNIPNKPVNEMLKTVRFYGKRKQLLKRKHCLPSRYTE